MTLILETSAKDIPGHRSKQRVDNRSKIDAQATVIEESTEHDSQGFSAVHKAKHLKHDQEK